ncbi:mitochondrial carrier domain-containing protein [Xylaria flabelliformis]|nr:mitochondrial carrier domain-containing protein [Xylaria flabelliformis]
MPPSSSSSSPSPTANSILPALHHASSGSLGTLISTCSLYPLSLVIARLQVQRQLRQHHPSSPEKEYDGIVDAFSRIWNSDGDGGLKAFYTGLAQDATKSVLDSFLFFLFYEWFRSLRLRSRRRAGRTGRRLGVAEELAVGMAAGACSRSFTTPIANIVTRKQTSSLVDPNSALGVREIMRRIREERGIAGFWSGYSASLVLTLNPSLTFFLQEILKTTFADQTYDDPGPRLTFLFAATSKAISSFVTYPFQIAKTRLQAGIPLDSDEKQLDLKSEDDAKEKSGPVRAVKAIAQRSIFGTVAQIVQTEGIGSLYDGVGAELLKGFFSHGTTMVAKDAVHKLLFKLYIFALGVLAEIRKQNPRATAARRVALFRLLQRRIGGTLAGKKSN